MTKKQEGGTTAKRTQTTIKKVLQKRNRYDELLGPQVAILGQLVTITNKLAGMILNEGHSHVLTTTNRDGNERQDISPLDKLYLKYCSETRATLRALGMNQDSRNGLPDDEAESTFEQLFNELRDGED